MAASTSNRPVRIRDVAQHVGVTPMTVSRALNGGYVAAEVREAVLKAVEELGYRPSLVARGMRDGKSRQVGVLVRNNSRLEHDETLAHPLAYEMVLGISEGLEAAGYLMSFVRLSDVDPEKHTQSSAFQGHLLDGLIVVSDVPAASASRLEELVPSCVWLDGNVWHETGCVRRDEVQAGQLAVRQIAEAGYERAVLLGYPNPTHYSAAQRIEGAFEAANECGLEIETAFFEPQSPQSGAFWARLSPRTAILATDIYVAHDLLFAGVAQGKCPGRDFALACCDESFRTGGLGWEQLARVRFDRFTLGQAAAQMILATLAGESPPSQKIGGVWKDGSTLPPLN